MVFKFRRSYNYKKTIIAILIFFMLLFLYLGNYNLVEGNNLSREEAIAYQINSKQQGEALRTNQIHNADINCDITSLELQQQENVNSNGGANTPSSQHISKSAQLNATLCSKNGMV